MVSNICTVDDGFKSAGLKGEHSECCNDLTSDSRPLEATLEPSIEMISVSLRSFVNVRD